MKAFRKLPVLLSREVEALYLSPISYAVLTVGLVLNGYSFYSMLHGSGGNVGNAVRMFFGGTPFFWIVVLFLPPLFTMRMFAEEKRSGTLEMVLTAPVGELEVVLAKFFAGLTFFMSLWMPSLLYVALVKSYGTVPDFGPLFTSYLGILLLGSLFTAVGLFASSVTSNQLFAAALAFVFNILLFVVPWLGVFMQRERLERFLNDLWILRHFADSFSKGLVDTAHVAFYVVLSGVFLFWTTRVLESQRWR